MSTPKTALNFFPVVLSGDEVDVGVGLWTSPEAADQQRTDNPGLRTWRDVADGSRLYAWYVSGAGALPEGFKPVTVKLDEAPSIFKRMLRDAVDARFLALGFTWKGGGWANYEKASLLGSVPALEAAAREPLGVYAKVVPRPHYTRDSSGKLVLGILLDVLYTTRLDVPASEWLAAGLEEDVVGSYVLVRPTTPTAEKWPALAGRTLGRVEARRGGMLRLTDCRDPDLTEVAASDVTIEPTRDNLKAYLEARHARAWEAGEKALKHKFDEMVRPRRRSEYATAAAQRLTHGLPDGLPIHGALRATFGPMLSIGSSAFPITRLKEPIYRFDPARESAVAGRVDKGLVQHGPYDKGKWRGRTFRLLVVALEENRRHVEEALRKFEHGVPAPQGVFAGFRKMYRLDKLEVVATFAPRSRDKEMVRYEGAAKAALDAAPERGAGAPKFDLVLVVTHSRFRDMATSENPYFQMKGLALLLDAVPTQAVFIETLRNSDYNLQYILNTMSLACYAKMGGTSHVLDVGEPDDGYTELVIGVGRAVVGEGRFDQGKEETVGFATVFRANGEYLYNDSTPYCERANYQSALEATIIRTVNEVAATQGLRQGAKLRLIFHVSRRPGKHEERAVLNAVGKLPKFQVEFALVHVNDDHHFRAFDKGNTEGAGRKGNKPDAALMTERGLCVSLGPDERLITFIGVDQYRGYGTPGPVLVRLDRRSTVATDVDYLAQQLYWLSFMDVGSLNPGVSPATISYAEKLARLTGNLRGVQRWTVDVIARRLGKRLWFI